MAGSKKHIGDPLLLGVKKFFIRECAIICYGTEYTFNIFQITKTKLIIPTIEKKLFFKFTRVIQKTNVDILSCRNVLIANLLVCFTLNYVTIFL